MNCDWDSHCQLLNRFPELENVVFKSKKFTKLLNVICDEDYFLSKAICFNKLSKCKSEFVE